MNIKICVIASALLLIAGTNHAQVPPGAAEVSSYTGLHAAAWRGDAAAVRRLALADSGVLDARDGQGRTPLHVATFARQRATVRALGEAGANLNLLENDRYDA